MPTSSSPILVAGGGGFIGGHLAAALLQRGHRVRVADVRPIDTWWQVHASADNRVLDLRQASLLHALARYAALLAWKAQPLRPALWLDGQRTPPLRRLCEALQRHLR